MMGNNTGFSRPFIRALGLIKQFSARVNGELGELAPEIARAVEMASQEVAEGKWDQDYWELFNFAKLVGCAHFLKDYFVSVAELVTNVDSK